jgi:hypothetical protein
VPVRFERDDARRLVRVTLDADVTPADLAAGLPVRLGDGTWTYATLVDARALPLVSSDEVRVIASRLATMTAEHGERGPVAVIVSRPVQYGIARMFSLIAEPTLQLSNVFYSFEQAEARLKTQGY